MAEFEPDYVLRWPPATFRAEVERLVRIGREHGCVGSWKDEVETLLRQAFGSEVPVEDFGREMERHAAPYGYDPGEEPF